MFKYIIDIIYKMITDREILSYKPSNQKVPKTIQELMF